MATYVAHKSLVCILCDGLTKIIQKYLHISSHNLTLLAITLFPVFACFQGTLNPIHHVTENVITFVIFLCTHAASISH